MSRCISLMLRYCTRSRLVFSDRRPIKFSHQFSTSFVSSCCVVYMPGLQFRFVILSPLELKLMHNKPLTTKGLVEHDTHSQVCDIVWKQTITAVNLRGQLWNLFSHISKSQIVNVTCRSQLKLISLWNLHPHMAYAPVLYHFSDMVQGKRSRRLSILAIHPCRDWLTGSSVSLQPYTAKHYTTHQTQN